MSLQEDSRYRTKYYIEYYDTPGNVLKGDGVTPAPYIVAYGHNYPMRYLFFDEHDGKNLDGCYTVQSPQSTMLTDWKHECYGYLENVPVDINTVDKDGVDGTQLMWNMEAELRRIVDAYPLGSVRTLTNMRPTHEDQGGWILYGMTCNLRYKRNQANYASDVQVSYGTTWEYDCNRLSGGIEGAWTLTQGAGSTCSQSVTSSPGYLVLAQTVFVADSYTSSGTNLSKSSTTYPKIRWRYRTTDSSKAKIIVEYSDASTQTILAETSASTFTVGTATLQTGKTVDHIHLYNCDGTGTVAYDFIQLYAGDFTFPNVLNNPWEASSRNVYLGMPSRVTNTIQNLGADSAMIDLICDLDVEQYHVVDNPTGASWKRVGDVDNGDVFYDILHNQSVAAPWQWLVWGNKKFRFTIDSVRHDGQEGTLTISGHEYSDSNKVNEYYYQRLGQDT